MVLSVAPCSSRAQNVRSGGHEFHNYSELSLQQRSSRSRPPASWTCRQGTQSWWGSRATPGRSRHSCSTSSYHYLVRPLHQHFDLQCTSACTPPIQLTSRDWSGRSPNDRECVRAASDRPNPNRQAPAQYGQAAGHHVENLVRGYLAARQWSQWQCDHWQCDHSPSGWPTVERGLPGPRRGSKVRRKPRGSRGAAGGDSKGHSQRRFLRRTVGPRQGHHCSIYFASSHHLPPPVAEELVTPRLLIAVHAAKRRCDFDPPSPTCC